MPDVDKLLSAIDWAEENSYGSDTDGELSADRAYSIRLYLGENVDPAPTGRSQVVDRACFETIQWILPSLCRIFANGSDLVSIQPIGPDDEEGAKQEAEYVNWVITKSNKWFLIFLTWAMDALMTRNAYVLAYKEKRRNVDLEVYERQTEEGVALLLQDGDVEVIESKQYPDDQAQPEPVVDPMTGQPAMDEMGQPVMGPPPMLYDLKVRRIGVTRKTCIKNLAPERVKVSQYAGSFRVADCDYFEYWDYKTISELRSEGFDVADDIASDELDDTQEDVVRDQFSESRDENKADPSMRRIKARMIWIRHDYDGDGIAELRYVVRLGKSREIPLNEEATSIPVACIVPNPLPHRHIGMSITDIMADLQRIKTTIMRQGLDNLYLSNNPQKVINENLVNLDDCLNSLPGGIIRTQDVNAIRYEQHPFVFQQAMEGLEYMDQVKENRSGTNRYFTGIDQNALNKTASGVQQLSTMAAQRVEQVARIFGSGLEDLAQIVHEIELKGGHKQETVKIRGQWVEVDPSSWKKRSDFNIAVGFAAGNKDAQVARLTMISQNQMQLMAMGVPVVQPQNLYETMLELTKASDFSSPERFWTDPAQAPPQQQQPDPNAQKLQADMVAKEAELNLEHESRQADHALKEQELIQTGQLEKYRIDKDSDTKILLAQMHGQMQGSNAIAVERERANTQMQKQDRMKVENLDKLDSVVESVEEIAKAASEQAVTVAKSFENVAKILAEALTAPKTIVRDKAGKAVGVKSG